MGASKSFQTLASFPPPDSKRMTSSLRPSKIRKCRLLPLLEVVRSTGFDCETAVIGIRSKKPAQMTPSVFNDHLFRASRTNLAKRQRAFRPYLDALRSY